MSEFNSSDHYIYYCRQEYHRRNRMALNQQKSPKYSIWVQPQKWQNDLSSFPRQAVQHHSTSSLCPYHWCPRSWLVVWRPRRPPRTNAKNKRCSFHHQGLECKSRKSKYSWGNRQIWPWRRKWSRAKANWILPRECTSHSKYSLSTTLETWTSPNGQHQNQIDYPL